MSAATLSSNPPRVRADPRKVALSFAEALLPIRGGIPGGDEATVARLYAFLDRGSVGVRLAFEGALHTLNASTLLTDLKPFHRLSAPRQERVLQAWETNAVSAAPLTLVSLLLKLVHFDTPRVYRALDGHREEPLPTPPPRWAEAVVAPEDIQETIECDVVVMGTGAGGAVVGHALAKMGHAVCFVEEGLHHPRSDFTGPAIDRLFRFHRGLPITVGNVSIPIFAGRMVGGSTALNTGTSLRPPRHILDDWEKRLGPEFGSDALTALFQEVESHLHVTPASKAAVGPVGEVIQRGCDALGWSAQALPRNAPDCEGKHFCHFGCPTEAKRSTNVSYIPPALSAGAMLVHGLRAREVWMEGGVAVGLKGISSRTGHPVNIRAKRVVLSGGALATPQFLRRQGLCTSSGQLGRNLSLHPSAMVLGEFDEPINGHRHVPQGYGSRQFLDDGILLVSAQPDVNIAATLFPYSGERMMDALSRINNMVGFAALVEDEPNGVIHGGSDELPLIRYTMNDDDQRRLYTAMNRCVRVLRAAGARRVFTLTRQGQSITTDAEERAFNVSPPKLTDFSLASYHPLGTCRIGANRRHSVVGLDNQTHDVPNLYVVDGSSVPGPPSVNPQITIMALATRAAQQIAATL